MKLRQCRALAENVFCYENMPEMIDVAYMNAVLVNKGAIAFFKDEIMGLIALPFSISGKLDVYGRPQRIIAYGKNGYNKPLNKGELVIMYDNYGRYPLILDIYQYAERMAELERTKDINIRQQRTPRIWQTSDEKMRTLKDILNNVDAYSDDVIAYDSFAIDEINGVLLPAPFVADKLQDEKEKLWNEFLRLIGVSNVSIQKKERNIKDEISASNGGTIASRFNRFEPRKKALEQIKEKFEIDIKVSYYDGLPTNMQEIEDFTESEVVENVSNI
jgi:hypothetical protein